MPVVAVSRAILGARRRVHVRRAAGPLRRLAPRRAAAARLRDQRRDVGRLGADRAGARRRAHRHGRLAVGVLDQPPADRRSSRGRPRAPCAVVHPTERAGERGPLQHRRPGAARPGRRRAPRAHQALASAAGCWHRWRCSRPSAFFLHERRTSQPVFTHTANSIAANVAAFGAGVAFLGAETYLPLQLQVGFDDGVRVVGVALLLCTLGWTTGSMTAARIGARPRNQIALGTGLTVAATFVMAIPAGGAVAPDRGLHVLGAGDGDREPRAVRGGAGRRRGGPRGPIDVEHPARTPGRIRHGRGRSPASCSRRRSRRRR